MTIDHIAHHDLITDQVVNDVFRIIGRIAMPLFCMIVAYGVTKSRNPWKFALRLYLFAVVVQVCLLIYDTDYYFNNWWNVFFTLSFGVAAASLLKLCTQMVKKYRSNMALPQILAIAMAFIGAFGIVMMVELLRLPIDYGASGVLLVVMFYIVIQHSMKLLKLAAVFIIALWCSMLSFTQWWVTSWGWQIQWFALMAVPFIWVFVDRKLKITAVEKYAFYVFYPLHMIIIFLIQTWFL